MKEYLIYHRDIPYIARAGAISTRGFPDREDPTKKVADDILRAAWFERDGSFICFDYDEPEIMELTRG